MNRIFTHTLQLALTYALTLLTHTVHSQGSGSALVFDGNDIVNCGDPITGSFDLTGDATFEAWIQLNQTPPAFSSGTGWTVAGKDGGAGLNHKWFFAIQDGHLAFHIQQPSGLGPAGAWLYSTPFALNLNEYYHVAFTKTGNNIDFFVNGVAVGGGTLPVAIADFPMAFTIGYSEPCCPFNGIIDEVRVWDNALSEAEIQEGMCQKLNGSEPNLVAYYRMDEGIDNTCSGGEDVCDLTGNGNHGTKF